VITTGSGLTSALLVQFECARPRQTKTLSDSDSVVVADSLTVLDKPQIQFQIKSEICIRLKI